ncbi:hypothetical protein [Myceligenerans crystallogenes]|uniref:hypothetical protein n=1 Tax=Myceligenerans crystallogenes TaxID=316335 RepID=UPI0031D39F3D
MNETFKKNWRGWIRSSDGYAIRIGSRTGIDYRDDRGEFRIDAEQMFDPWQEVVVLIRSIPDTEERPRAEVVERLGKLFDYAGRILTLV